MEAYLKPDFRAETLRKRVASIQQHKKDWLYQNILPGVEMMINMAVERGETQISVESEDEIHVIQELAGLNRGFHYCIQCNKDGEFHTLSWAN